MNPIKEEASLAQDSVVSAMSGVGPETSVSVTTADAAPDDGSLLTAPDIRPMTGTEPPDGDKKGGKDKDKDKDKDKNKDKDKDKSKSKKAKGKDADEGDDEPHTTDGHGKDSKKSKKHKEAKKDTTRELLTLKISSIQVLDLIPAHRFKKNSPWIKVDYGEEHHWEHEYQKDTQGVKADFLDLDWEFILQRDTRHRDDLVVTVCSDELIVGRYMLAAQEFMNMPVTKSGFFKVSGKVVNALGIAGKVVVVFKKAIAEPPKAPRFMEATPYTVKANTLPHDTRSYIRVVSIAVADLKQISMMERNSPHVIFTCGHEWKKTTDVQVGAGLAAKWNRLPWKLVMDKFFSLLVEVKSEKELVGMVQMTLEEIRAAPVDDMGFTEIIRQLTDGSTFSGRIRILLFIQEMPPTADANTFHVDLPGLQYANEYSREQQNTARGDIYAAQKEPVNAAIAMSSNLIRGCIEYCPFVMRVSEAGCFETRKCDPFKPNSLSISAACSGWGGSTFQVKNCGADAYWVGLASTWRFVVDDSSKVHINVWSRKSFVGSVTLSAQEIMKNPIDPDGSAEIMLTIKDEGKSAGRIRLNCVFEYFRKGENTNYDPQPEPVVYVPPRAKLMELDQWGDVPKYELPSIAKVISISVVDLKSMHLLKKNSPRVKIVCDRKQALTTVMKRAGKSARWVDLDWDIPINEGCIMMIYIYSEDKQVGFMELEAHHIVDEPLDTFGMTSISAFVRDHDGLSTGKLTIIFQLESVPDLDVYDSIVNGVDKDPYNLKAPTKSHVNKEDEDPILELLATQPFFSLKDATETGTGIMLQITISELDCTDLDPVHYFGKKNSPMVSAACGRWADTTAPKENAGEGTFWTGLHWQFLMDDGLNVQFVVGSGDKVIGSVKCSAKEFAVARADQRSIKRVTLNMYKDKRGHPHFTGRLKVTYKLNVVRESSYIKRPRGIERLNVEELNIPFNAIVTRVVARGLPKVHTIGPNEPRFRMSYDDWAKTTSVSTGGNSEEAAWDRQDLDPQEWTCSVCNEDMHFTFTVMSSSELIGLAEVMAADVMKIPRNIKGIAEVVVTILKDGKSNGRLQVFLKLQNDKVIGPEISEEEEAEEQKKIQEQEDIAIERQQYWEAKQMLLGNEIIRDQQEKIAPIMTTHQLEKDRADAALLETQRRTVAAATLERTRIEQEMTIKSEEVMMMQHKAMLSTPNKHKFAPVGDFPAGYVPPDEHIARLQKGSGLDEEDDDGHSEGYDGVEDIAPDLSPEAMDELQAAITKETAGFQFRIKSDLQVAKDMVAEAGLTGLVVVFEDEKGDIKLVKVHQESLAPASQSSQASLKSSNPPKIPGNIRMAGDDNSVLGVEEVEDFEGFGDEGSVVHAPALKSSARVVNTAKGVADFEGNLDDDVSIATSNKRSQKKRGNKVVPVPGDLLDKTLEEGTAMLEKAGAMMGGSIDGSVAAKKSYKDGLISNKFDDHAIREMAHVNNKTVPTQFAMQIKRVSVLNVPSQHMLSKNSLKIVALCTGAAPGVDTAGFAMATSEPMEHTSPVMKNCADIANWLDLNFDFPEIFGKRRQKLEISLSSCDVHICSIDWKTDDLYIESLEEKPGALVTKFCPLREGATSCGKIKLQYTIVKAP